MLGFIPEFEACGALTEVFHEVVKGDPFVAVQGKAVGVDREDGRHKRHWKLPLGVNSSMAELALWAHSQKR